MSKLQLVALLLGSLLSVPTVQAADKMTAGETAIGEVREGSRVFQSVSQNQEIPWGRNPFLTPEEEARGGRSVDGELVIETIITGPDKSVATLGGRTVIVGDRIGENRVVAIRPDAVVLERNGRRTIIRPPKRSRPVAKKEVPSK